LDIKQIKYFLQICESRSFSKAAKHLYITQQGLSKAIKVLEEELGVPLFYRTKSGVVLTEYGECLRRKSRNILNETNILLDEIDKLKVSNNSTINVAFAFGVMNALPVHFVSTFREMYQDIELDIMEYPDYACEEAILKEKADIGFTISPIEIEELDYASILSVNVERFNDESFTWEICLTTKKGRPISAAAKKFRNYTLGIKENPVYNNLLRVNNS